MDYLSIGVGLIVLVGLISLLIEDVRFYKRMKENILLFAQESIGLDTPKEEKRELR